MGPLRIKALERKILRERKSRKLTVLASTATPFGIREFGCTVVARINPERATVVTI